MSIIHKAPTVTCRYMHVHMELFHFSSHVPYQKAVRTWKLMFSKICSGAFSSMKSMMKIL